MVISGKCSNLFSLLSLYEIEENWEHVVTFLFDFYYINPTNDSERILTEILKESY